MGLQSKKRRKGTKKSQVAPHESLRLSTGQAGHKSQAEGKKPPRMILSTQDLRDRQGKGKHSVNTLVPMVFRPGEDPGTGTFYGLRPVNEPVPFAHGLRPVNEPVPFAQHVFSEYLQAKEQ